MFRSTPGFSPLSDLFNVTKIWNIPLHHAWMSISSSPAGGFRGRRQASWELSTPSKHLHVLLGQTNKWTSSNILCRAKTTAMARYELAQVWFFPPWLCSPIVLCELSSLVGPPVDDVPHRVWNRVCIDYRHHSSCEGRFGMIIRTFFCVCVVAWLCPTAKTKNICVVLDSASHDSFVSLRLKLRSWPIATWRYLGPIWTIRLNFGANSLDRTLHLEAAGQNGITYHSSLNADMHAACMIFASLRLPRRQNVFWQTVKFQSSADFILSSKNNFGEGLSSARHRQITLQIEAESRTNECGHQLII